jgi:hypothetical protein
MLSKAHIWRSTYILTRASATNQRLPYVRPFSSSEATSEEEGASRQSRDKVEKSEDEGVEIAAAGKSALMQPRKRTR